MAALKNKHYGMWRTQRELKLATLHAPDLRKFDLSIDQLTATDSKYYAQTARWGGSYSQCAPRYCGLQWTSYRGDLGVAYVLFWDRVRPEDLALAGAEVVIR